MPNFLPPIVVGPLSTENKYVKVETHQPGTTLKIISNGANVIGEKPNADGGKDIVMLDMPLVAGMAITATQEDPGGGAASNPTPEPVIVWSVPSPLGEGRIEGPIYHCVEFLHISGLFPGAKFEIHQTRFFGDPIRPESLVGHGDTYNGFADVTLTRGINRSLPLILRQAAGMETSNATHPYPIYLLPLKELPTLIINEALECGYYVDVEGTFNGITVNITRQRDKKVKNLSGVGWDGHTRFWVSEEFQVLDIVSAGQVAYGQCNIKPSQASSMYEVQKRDISRPKIDPPVCRDAQKIYLTDIEPGAQFTVYAYIPTKDGEVTQQIGIGTFAKEDPRPYIYINPIGSLPNELQKEAPRIGVVQTVCGKNSRESIQVKMEPLGAAIVPAFSDVLYECACVVRVKNVRPGSIVSIHSQMHGGNHRAQPEGGRIGDAHAKEDEVCVPVHSGLIEGDTVWAYVSGCQKNASISTAASVVPWTGRMQSMIVEPVYPSDTTISLSSLVTGARLLIDIVGVGHPAGRRVLEYFACGPEMKVYVGQLFDDDRITVYQSLCNNNARENQSNTVIVEAGQINASIVPALAYYNENNTILVQATDPRRGDVLVGGEVLFDGSTVGQTNREFGWRPATLGIVNVLVNAPGYESWNGILRVGRRVTGGGFPRRGGAPPNEQQRPMYTYTCSTYEGGASFSVSGTGFPPKSLVTIRPHVSGIYRVPNPSRYRMCGNVHPDDHSFGPFQVDSEGEFNETISVRFDCLPGCSIRIFVDNNKAFSIVHPEGPNCNCG